MKTKPRSKADPIERQIESAFRPGTFIRDGECFSFVSGLEEVAAAIDTLVATEPVRAVALYETFLAGCHAKADELDDSSGSFGQFARDLICKWIKSRPATGADPHKTVTTLLVWMEDGPFAFCYRIEKDTAAAFDKAGLAAFEKQIRERFDAASVDPSSWTYRRTAEILREIYIAQEDIQAYIGLAEQTELKPEDCLVIAKVLVPWQPNQALGWVERGRALDREKQFRSAAAHDLDKLHRELLSKLGRADEALEGAWGDFRKHPSKFTYDDLMKFVPTTERTAWHEKALNAASGADLHCAARIIHRNEGNGAVGGPGAQVFGRGSRKGEPLCHRPAAKRLEKNHPGLAARLWRAQGMRIVNAKKSKYYNAALLKFRAGPRLLSAGGTGDRMGANCALGLGIALPQDRLHQWISGVGCRLETQRTTSVLRAREDAMGRAAREKCLLRTPKQHDPVSPGEIGRNEPTTL